MFLGGIAVFMILQIRDEKRLELESEERSFAGLENMIKRWRYMDLEDKRKSEIAEENKQRKDEHQALDAIKTSVNSDPETAALLTSFAKIVTDWRVTQKEAAAMADMSLKKWLRAKEPAFTGKLTRDQRLRLIAVIGIHEGLNSYFSESLAKTWFTRPNSGLLFRGSRPIDVAIAGGLPQILIIRSYVAALNCSA